MMLTKQLIQNRILAIYEQMANLIYENVCMLYLTKFIFLLIFLIFISGCSLSAGLGGANQNTTYGLGILSIANGHIFGAEFVFDTTSNESSDVLDYKIPHNSYNITKEHSSELSFLVNYGQTIFDWFGIYGGLGCSFKSEYDIAVSRATGWRYKQETNTDVNLEAGFQHYLF